MMEWLREFSKGDSLRLFWWLFRRRDRTKNHLSQRLLTFLLDRIAHRRRCRHHAVGRYQNVTIGEVDRAAPEIGDRCLIGAGAVIVGGIKIGSNVKIGAGAAVSADIPDGCTVVAQPPRVMERRTPDDRPKVPGLEGDRPGRPGP